MLAGLQGAILLIAAKRQDAIAAAMAQHDYDTDLQSKAGRPRAVTSRASSPRSRRRRY
ncbi:putative membrane protein [Arthrobacter sp. UYCu723]